MIRNHFVSFAITPKLAYHQKLSFFIKRGLLAQQQQNVPLVAIWQLVGNVIAILNTTARNTKER